MRKPVNTSVPFIEALEGRIMMSATYTCGPTFITIKGDSAASAVVTVADDGTNFTITGATKVGSGTLPLLANANKVTIKYSTKNQADTFNYNAATVIAHPLKSLVFNGGTAADHANVSGGFIKGLTINCGNGFNQVYISDTTIVASGKLTITGGKNADNIYLGGYLSTSILGGISISLGASGTGPSDHNIVDIMDGTYGTAASAGKPATKFSIVDGNDKEIVEFTGVTTVNADLSMQLNGGIDEVHGNYDNAADTLSFNGNVLIDTGAGNDMVRFATSAMAATATFAKNLTIKLGDDNDLLEMTGGLAGNSVTVNGNLNVDMGKSTTTTTDRFDVGDLGVNDTVLTLNGTDNVINFGDAGLKGTDNINAGSIVLGAGSSTWIGVKKKSKATLSTDLKNELAAGLQGFDGSIGGLYLGVF